jgi:hypothetical protein
MWLPALKAIAANLVVIISAFGFGTLLLRLLPDSFSRLTRSLCALIGGFGILGLILFVVGYLSFMRWTIAVVLVAGLALATRSKLHPFGVGVRPGIIPAGTVAFVLTITALSGLLEPVGDWNIDGVAYHLVGPKAWVRDGMVRPIPDNMPTSFPSAVEMVFAGLYAFGGDRAPGLSAAWTLALLLALAASLGLRCGLDVRGAWWVAALVVTMPAVYEGSVGAFIDAVYAAFILAAVRVGLDAKERKHFAVFGLFCGLAMATKYPALVALPALVICISWSSENCRRFRDVILNASTAIAAACVVASPMYLKNWFFLGSPIYPPSPSVGLFLHVKYLSVDAMRAFYAYTIHRATGHGRGILHFFSLPFNLTYHTADFNGAGGIGLAPLAFAPLGVFASWREPFARRLALIGFLLLLLWFLTAQESRYLIHCYALSAVFAVLGWRYVLSVIGNRGKMTCATVAAISLGYGLFMIVKPQLAGLTAVISARRAEQRRETHIPFVQSFDYLNHDPQFTKLLILDASVPAYYSDKDYVKPFGQWGEQVFPDAATPAEILVRLNELHVSHVLDVQSTVSGFVVPTNYPGLVLEFERPGQRVYKVVGNR